MTTLLMKAQKAWQKAKRPKSAPLLAAKTGYLTQTAYRTLLQQDETDMDLIRGIKAMRATVTREWPATFQFVSDLERAMRSPIEPIWVSGRRPMADSGSKVAPVEAPAGWPPGEAPATVVTSDGLRAVGQRQYPLGGTPLPDHNPNLGARNDKAWQARCIEVDGKHWQCCTCGTCNPADPCIPGAYF